MSLSVKVNGVELNKYLKVTDLRRGIGPARSNSLQKLGMTHGEHYLGYSKGAKVYEMDFVLRYDLISKRRTLAGILDVTEPVQVIFGDEPDKYVLAIPEGDIDVAEKNFLGFGTIKWVIPEGYAHSVSESIYTVTPNADGVLAMQIANNGTETAELSFEATMTSDNGFLGAVGPLGAMEFGSISEVDGYVDMSEMVLRKELNQAQKPNFKLNGGYIQWKKSNGGLDNKVQGDFDWSSNYRAVASNFGTAFADNRWYGPTLSIGIPAKTSDGSRNKNWQSLVWLQHKSKNNAKTLGRQEFNYSLGDTSVVSFTVYDDKAGSMDTIFEFRIFGQVKESFHVNSDFKEFWGGFQLFKNENSIQFKIVNNYNQKTLVKTYVDDRLESAEIDMFTYWAAKFKNYAHCEMSLNHINFSWTGTQDFVDVPNRYSSGDILKYEGSTGKFFVNELLTMNDIIQGSTDLKIPPGIWTVEFYYSDFGKTPPNIVGTLRERWL